MFIRKLVVILNAFLFISFFSQVVSAEVVQINHKNLTLNAKLTLASDKNLSQGVLILVHGTLAHKNMDTIKNISEVLNERGFSTLSINLSLGINNRDGMYDCNKPHYHEHLDALDEIGAWVNWLKAKGAGDIVLFGHSRGGNQALRYVIEKDKNSLKKLILLAPSTWDMVRSSKNYEKRHGTPLKEIIAKVEDKISSGNGASLIKGIGMLYCSDADATANSFFSYYQKNSRFDTPSILDELSIPALIIAGGNDQIVQDLISRVKNIADGRQVYLGVVEDADHFFLDLYAEDAADFIEPFLLQKN